MKKIAFILLIILIITYSTNVLMSYCNSPERKFIEFNESYNIINIDGKQIEMDTVPIIVNERFMIPVRFLAKALGGNANWDQIQKYD